LSPTGRFHRTGVASRRGVGLESAQIDLLVQIASGCDRHASGGFEPARKWRASFADHRRLRPNLRRRLFDVGVEQRAPNCRPTVLSDALVDQFDQVGQIYTAGTGRVRSAATVGRNDRRTSGQEFDRRIRTFASGGTVALSGRPAVVWPGLFESGWPVPASCPTVGRTVGSEFLDRRPRRARTVVERDGPTAELSRLFVPVGPVQTSRMGYVEQQFELGRRWSAPDAQPRRHARVARSVGRGGGIAAGRNRRSHPRRHPLRKRSPSLPAGRRPPPFVGPLSPHDPTRRDQLDRRRTSARRHLAFVLDRQAAGRLSLFAVVRLLGTVGLAGQGGFGRPTLHRSDAQMGRTLVEQRFDALVAGVGFSQTVGRRRANVARHWSDDGRLAARPSGSTDPRRRFHRTRLVGPSQQKCRSVSRQIRTVTPTVLRVTRLYE
ncbi:putative bromodomain and WD repeat-containing protein 2, partial [Trichinella spiralis]|uniref:putative bromodomain and WD repeat-containing protein 2 n=1 Tax=Trichinella spiralis TaxID=6334 RepID=UPI0001EFC86C